jgi:hypothetical protein
MSPLSGWQNFFIIVGTSAGALVGLLFVAVTLVAQRRTRVRTGVAGWGIAAFNTPTLVHFGAVLLITLVLSAPWPSLSIPALVLGLCGLAGVLYTLVVTGRLRHLGVYAPALDDWLWYALGPLVVYTALLAAALLLPGDPVPALFAIGAVILLLLFLGIRNAWDLVTWVVVGGFEQLGDRTGTD